MIPDFRWNPGPGVSVVCLRVRPTRGIRLQRCCIGLSTLAGSAPLTEHASHKFPNFLPHTMTLATSPHTRLLIVSSHARIFIGPHLKLILVIHISIQYPNTTGRKVSHPIPSASSSLLFCGPVYLWRRPTYRSICYESILLLCVRPV